MIITVVPYAFNMPAPIACATSGNEMFDVSVPPQWWRSQANDPLFEDECAVVEGSQLFRLNAGPSKCDEGFADGGGKCIGPFGDGSNAWHILLEGHIVQPPRGRVCTVEVDGIESIEAIFGDIQSKRTELGEDLFERANGVGFIASFAVLDVGLKFVACKFKCCK